MPLATSLTRKAVGSLTGSAARRTFAPFFPRRSHQGAAFSKLAGQNRTGASASRRRALSSVTMAIHLMKAFTLRDHELGISELARRLGIAKSTIHRLATALLEEGLLQQNPETGRYRLGLGLFTLGTAVRGRMDVAAEARNYLYDLRRATNENARLAVLDLDSVVFLYDLESAQPVRLRSHTGQSLPAYCTAEGLCLMTGLGETELERLLERPREPRTESSVTDAARILKRVESVRQQGYAVEDEESEVGTFSIAAPIMDALGAVVAAVSVAGPRSRFKKAQVPGMATQVKTAAREISIRLGYSPTQGRL